jgi:hypothetical protein
MIKTILISIVGYYFGKGILGGILIFLDPTQDHDNPNPETIWGNIGAVKGIFLAIWIYKS